MSSREFAGAGQKDREPDRRQQPQKRDCPEQCRLAAHDEIDRKHQERDEPGQEMGSDKGLVPG
jgi:hypothetical protein